MTNAQIERLDDIHNRVHELLCYLAGTDEDTLPWDMHVIGEIADTAQTYICGELKIMSEQEFNPCEGD